MGNSNPIEKGCYAAQGSGNMEKEIGKIIVLLNKAHNIMLDSDCLSKLDGKKAFNDISMAKSRLQVLTFDKVSV